MTKGEYHSAVLRGYRAAAEITRIHAKTFYFGSHFLPGPLKKAAYSVYAVCRISDDAVDRSGRDGEQRLKTVEDKIAEVYSGRPLKAPLLSCLRETVQTYHIPKTHFDELIQGMRADLTVCRYPDFAALEDYCYKVAGVVGLMMLKIFGTETKDARTHAVELGTAMQLTNIIRDVREDFARGRIYLPQCELRDFGLTEEDIAAGQVTERWSRFLQFQIRRARSYYEQSTDGIRLIPSQRIRIVVCLLKDLYAGILNAVERNRYDVFSHRAHLTFREKISQALCTVFRTE